LGHAEINRPKKEEASRKPQNEVDAAKQVEAVEPASPEPAASAPPPARYRYRSFGGCNRIRPKPMRWWNQNRPLRNNDACLQRSSKMNFDHWFFARICLRMT